MRKSIAAVALTAIVGSSFIGASPANAGGCVSRKEYRKVERGMSKERVARIFDSAGQQTSQYNIGGVRYQSREYKSCISRFGFISIDYKNGKVDGRYVYWG